MAVIFTEILAQVAAKGITPEKTLDATNWFRTEAQKVSEDEADPQTVIQESAAQLKRTITIGKMYLFNYQPKYAATLKYYDTFPLIFPYDIVKGGFYGINMHYLPLTYRAKMMDALYSFTGNNITEKSKISLSYELLSSVSKLKYYRPCVKHYLNSSLKSRFLEIPATLWDTALFLPLERFQKASKQQVYRDSRKIIRGQ